jgi:hypothetical protein
MDVSDEMIKKEKEREKRHAMPIPNLLRQGQEEKVGTWPEIGF